MKRPEQQRWMFDTRKTKVKGTVAHCNVQHKWSDAEQDNEFVVATGNSQGRR